MKIAIMQPYYFPYAGYFSLIKHVDSFILFDSVQFIRHGWIERNRILKPTESWQYINVPLVKHSRSTIIKDIIINNQYDWKTKTLAQLQHYKKIAPYYENTIDILKEIFSQNFTSIVKLNMIALEKICKYLNISTPLTIFSEMNLTIEKVNAPDEWALNICKAIGNINEYWNPPGGQEFFDRNKYDKNGIQLKFHQLKLPVYNQKRTVFEPGLSIIDVIMFNSPDIINTMLDNYELF